MAGRLEGKVALITAAGQGIGHATALAMAREGATVYATDVNAKALESYTGTAGITARTLDVLDDAAVAKTIAQLPPLSILCAWHYLGQPSLAIRAGQDGVEGVQLGERFLQLPLGAVDHVTVAELERAAA